MIPDRAKNAALLFASLIFYAWGEPVYILLLILSVTLNFFLGLRMAGKEGAERKISLIIGILLNLGMLGYFKYYNFFGSILNRLLGNEILPYKHIALPIGISFYTFQILSYLIDLYRGKISVQKSWMKLALYIAFFPQLIAGPIVRYNDIASQLENHPSTPEKTSRGIRRFCEGLAKKVLISNSLGNVVDRIYDLPMGDMSTSLAWIAAAFYMLQIYYDFSGYSDMAIGLAGIFGFRFEENFDYPYTSASVREFWRRWHISLSAWFREYLYIPLGGNRGGKTRTIINLFIVFLATGLWHGASLHFVFWGVFHGFFSILERMIPKSITERIPRFLKVLYTLLEVMIGWIFFRVPGLRLSLEYIRMLFVFRPETAWSAREFLSPQVILIAVLAVLLSGWLQRFLFPRVKLSAKARETLSSLGAITWLLLSMLRLVTNTYNPFIYFRF